jgi:hypothetical protein
MSIETFPSHVLRLGAAIALVVTTAACAGNTLPPQTATPSPTQAAPPSSTASAPTQSALPSLGASASTVAAPSGSPAPPALTGAWHTVLQANDEVTLGLHGVAYGIHRKQDAVSGKIAVQGDQISFFGSTVCGSIGTYRWSRKGDSLTFTSVVPDPCGGRAQALDGITYTISK